MTKQEFEAIVDDAVKNGANRKEAEAYVRAGYKVSFGSQRASGQVSGQQSAVSSQKKPKKRANR